MNKEQFNIAQNDPEIPEVVRKASQNHGGMIVPEDFFASFERKMNAVIDAEALAHQPVLSTQQAEKSLSGKSHWIGVAAAAVAIMVIGAAFHFDWFSSHIAEQQGLMAVADETEDVDSTEEAYYTSLSDYEVYDLICGL